MLAAFVTASVLLTRSLAAFLVCLSRRFSLIVIDSAVFGVFLHADF